jgi:hypothetical protein
MLSPESILADEGLTSLIDLAEPVCVILSAVLHFTDAETARHVVASFGKAIVPGSYLIISVGSGNRSEGENFTSAYTAARLYIYSQEDLASFFDGFDLVPPGVVPVSCWSSDGLVPHGEVPTATFLGGVAKKPAR